MTRLCEAFPARCRRVAGAAVAAVALLLPAAGAPAARAQLVFPATPPMGWNPWYGFRCGTNEALVLRTAALIVRQGYAAAGYRYVNLDDCWEDGRRGPHGELVADPARFPHGIAALADGIHRLGLKLGIYLDSGTATCAGLPGSGDHLADDARTVAGWGVDLVKVDYCNTHGASPQPLYAAVSRAFAAAPRPVVLSFCEWGVGSPWRWAPELAATWRTTLDYTRYGAPHDWWGSLLRMTDRNAPLARYAHPGAFNDPDILLTGSGLISDVQGVSQLSLWSMLAAPLLLDADLSGLDPVSAAALRDPGVLAVDQDPLGRQAVRVQGGAHQIWVRPLTGGGRAVLLFNTARQATTIHYALRSLGLRAPAGLVVRDLWAHRSARTAATAGLRADLPPYGVAMYRITPIGQGTARTGAKRLP